MLKLSSETEKKLIAIVTKHAEEEGNIISILQDTQDAFGYIPEDAVRWFSKKLGIPESRFYGVMTFYSQFHLKPRGKNIITACCGTACYVKGSERLINSLRRELNIREEEDTTDDREFTIERVACVGACSMAPVVIINKNVYGGMIPDKITRVLKKYRQGKSYD